MNFPIMHIAKHAKCQTFLVDSLFWWWSSIPKEIHLADIYFCQNFIQPIQQKINNNHIQNAQIVAPITSKRFQKSRKIDQAIINFGGCDGQVENSFILVGKNSHYPFIILKRLLPLLQKHFKQILVTGREHVMQKCQQQFAADKVSFAMLSPKQMLSELHRSQICLTTPGIQTFYDAADKLPLFFLPPSNHSHVDNLQLFVKHKIAHNYFNWPNISSLEYTTRQQKIDMVLNAIRLFADNDAQQYAFTKSVQNFLKQKHQWSTYKHQQQKILRSLGQNGAQQIINAIHNFTSQHKTSMMLT